MILLAHSYFLRDDPKQTARMKPYAPLATLLAAGLLRARGHELTFFDATLAPGVDAFVEALDVARPRVVAIMEDNFNFLTKMCTLRMRESTLAMVGAARARGCRVVVNGSDAADRAALYLAAGADAVLLGEGEMGLLELAELWAADASAGVGGVAGVAWGGVEGVHRTPARPPLGDVDSLPLPAWDLVDVEVYRREWQAAHGRFSWSMVTSRGCPYGCNWCAKPIFGRRYAQRSPAAVAEEMKRLREEVKPDHIWFADDIFGLTPEWIRDFAREVAQRGARTPFMMQSRVNLMRPATVAALAEAGAEEVWLGVESGSQRVLDAMQKGSRVDEARSATRTLKAAGVRACWFLQLGYPPEQWEDILRTRDLLREERPDDVGVSVAYPLPGTRFYETVRQQLGSKRNWEDTDDLAMLFHGTFGTDLYRRVRDLLHEESRTGVFDDLPWIELSREATGFRGRLPVLAAG
jgi:anaerobic magnesium-protoporphyrin IX monomethyl ester cyclase